MDVTLFILALITFAVFFILMIYVINFIKKTALLIDDTRANLNRQTKQLGETLEKVDDMVVDIHSFVKQASSSLEKFNEMSDQITGVVRKIDTKANNLMVVADDLSSIARGVVSSVEKPIRGIADFIGNIGNYINKIKSFFPTKLKN